MLIISLVSLLKHIYLGEDAVFNFFNSIIKESKYCSDVMRKHFHKELLMTKKDNEILKILLNVWFVTMIMLIMLMIIWPEKIAQYWALSCSYFNSK